MQAEKDIKIQHEKRLYQWPKAESIHHLIELQTERNPKAIAITALGRIPLTYSRLLVQVNYVVKTLNVMGVGRNDRVAIVLPNGPELAVLFLAVAAGATSAPLNPAYRISEFDFYLSDLKAQALIVQLGMDSPARAAAEARGIPIIELLPLLEAEAGVFTLTGDEYSFPTRDGIAQPDDVALMLHTSGTTSRPKLVPLTHTNLCTTAYNIQTTLNLTKSDRCLNVMPLYHIHGLSTIFSSLAAGASVVCTPGFYAPKFFEWIEMFQPTWYTAAPTIHQAILSRTALNQDIIAHCPLRFIRSASSALPPQVMTKLESVFNIPMIEAYGMTEASPQITSNPLPPRKRKRGSVGVAAGPEVAIMDEKGNLLSQGEPGEIVIRGGGLMRGYENNSEANQRSFTKGWFRTGDQGFLDTEGYLFITGRLKEIINRGGEKISPREVDEVLMDHPSVARVVTFAVPHAKLGEDVATAVVLHKNALATARELREFIAARLADFKVPRQVLILDEIPQSSTSKLQRIGLAEKLDLIMTDPTQSTSKPDFVGPRTHLEEILAEIWTQVLGLEQVSIYDKFLDLGGDSMIATQLVSRVRQALQVELSLFDFFEAPTVADQALVVEHILLNEIEELTQEEAQHYSK